MIDAEKTQNQIYGFTFSDTANVFTFSSVTPIISPPPIMDSVVFFFAMLCRGPVKGATCTNGECEFRKLLFVTRDLKVLRDP